MMQLLKKKKLPLIVSAVLLCVLIGTDFLFYLNGGFPSSVYFFRELLILMVLASLVPMLLRSKFVAHKDVTSKLKGLYLYVALIYVLFLILKLILSPLSRVIKIGPESRSPLFVSLDAFSFGLIFSIATAGILVAVLLILRDLIYFKRRKSSSRNFNLLLVFLGLQIAFVNVRNNGFALDFQMLNLAGEAVLYVLIVLMVVNSLRNAWVNYLKKRQKLHCVWLSVPLIVGAVLFQTSLARSDTISTYSTTLSSIIENVGLFLCIYLGMSFFSLLLHLPTAGIFDRKIREIESLHDLSRTLSSVFDSAKIGEMITSKAAAIIDSTALWLQLRDTETDQFAVVSAENTEADEISQIPIKPSNGLDGWIIENRQSVLINELSKDPRGLSIKDWNKNLNSILGVPLVSKNEILGVLYSAKSEAFGYDEEDRELLQAFANQATIALENSRLFEEVVSKERFEHELKVAQDAQRKLLPKKMPEVPGLDIDGISVTANEVGGDYYDFFKVDDKIAIAVADVSGKGAKAAFYMAQLKGIIESLSGIYTSPKELLLHVNRSLFRNLESSSFISLIYAVIDAKKKELVFTRAGHCPLLVCSNGKNARFVEPGGMGLGLEYGSKFEASLEEKRLKLKSGDVLMFYTDGVIEARNPRGDEFDQDRLKDFVLEHGGLGASALKAALVDEIRKFVVSSKYHDDMTFVMSKVD
jgi:serine phosphatase RsbU (regulator of sigma subunit)